MNYEKLMNANPTKLGEIRNNLNQLIEFYEHPMMTGLSSSLIAVCNELKLSEITDFYVYELDDITATNKYCPRPMFVDGVLCMGVCRWY